jgi:hypothetical protein
MIEFAILGSAVFVSQQVAKLSSLLEQHGCPSFVEDTTANHVWQTGAGGQNDFFCFHVKVDLMVVPKHIQPKTKRFLADALKLPGVYVGGCPEHDKQTSWGKFIAVFGQSAPVNPAQPGEQTVPVG